MTIDRILRDVGKQLYRLRFMRSQAYLAKIESDQKTTFNILRNRFSETYDNLRKYNISEFTTAVWENYNAKLEKVFLPLPPFSFLRDRIITGTMFVTAGGKWLREEVSFLEKRISKDKLKTLLQEDYVGNPLLLNYKYLTSHNSIHHLYHLIRFLEKTRCNLDQIDTIVEWGGGYGKNLQTAKNYTIYVHHY